VDDYHRTCVLIDEANGFKSVSHDQSDWDAGVLATRDSD